MDNFLLIVVIILIPFAIAGFSYAPWVPTRKEDIGRTLDLLAIKSGTKFYELGCGDGRVVFDVASRYNITAVGIELNYFLYLLCRVKKFLFYRNYKISFTNKNLFKVNLKDADIIYTFGMPEKMEKLTDKIKKECKKGTQIVSYTFPIKGLSNEIKNKPTTKTLSIYLYKV